MENGNYSITHHYFYLVSKELIVQIEDNFNATILEYFLYFQSISKKKTMNVSHVVNFYIIHKKKLGLHHTCTCLHCMLQYDYWTHQCETHAKQAWEQYFTMKIIFAWNRKYWYTQNGKIVIIFLTIFCFISNGTDLLWVYW